MLMLLSVVAYTVLKEKDNSLTEKTALIITTEPTGADVVLKNDNVKRKSPLKLSLQYGKYEIIIKKDGYYEEKKEIQLEKGKEKELNIHLKKTEVPEQKGIVINTIPQHADIFINNQHYGKSRLELSLQTGEYEIRITKDCYYEEKTKIRIEKQGKGTFDIPLKPIPVTKDDSAEKLQRARDFVENAYQQANYLCQDLKEISPTQKLLEMSKKYSPNLTDNYKKQIEDLELSIEKGLSNYRDVFNKLKEIDNAIVNESFEKYKQKGKVSSKIYEQVRNHFNQYVQTRENFQRWRDDLKNVCCDSTS